MHLTLDLGGQARFGPDVEWIDALRYEVDPARATAFYASIRAFWPGLPDDALQPAYAGIRPKLAPGEPPADFIVQGAAQHGVRCEPVRHRVAGPPRRALAQRVGDMTAYR